MKSKRGFFHDIIYIVIGLVVLLGFINIYYPSIFKISETTNETFSDLDKGVIPMTGGKCVNGQKHVVIKNEGIELLKGRLFTQEVKYLTESDYKKLSDFLGGRLESLEFYDDRYLNNWLVDNYDKASVCEQLDLGEDENCAVAFGESYVYDDEVCKTRS